MDDGVFRLAAAPATTGKTKSIVLRPYQVEGCRALDAELSASGRALGILATGTGKTELAAELIRNTAGGVLFIAPLKQLVWQTAQRLRASGIQCGVEQGDNRSDERVTVACYASLLSRKRYERYLGTLDLVVVDEVHHNYSRRSIEMLGNLTQGGVRLLGLTASPDRSKGDPLTKFYGNVGYYYAIREATLDGWLVPAQVWLTVIDDMDLTQVRSSRFGDWSADDLARVMQQERVVQAIASLVEQHHDGMPSVVFCASIRQTELLIDVLGRRGLNAVMVHSEMDDAERRLHLQDFEAGRVNIICNVGVLTLGWDSPKVRKLFLARPTKSRAVYVQQYGRGTRALPGVVDGHPDVQSRISAIARSDKPFFEVFDITDSSRHNDLCCSLDVLHPDLEPKLLQRARKGLEGRRIAASVDVVVAAARAQEAREQEARDRLEWHKRADMTTDSGFRHFERDMHQPAEDSPRRKRWHMLFGKHKGKPLKDVPTGYLNWVARESNCRNMAFIQAVVREISSRN
jgi:superfamily II DNA or RNA helicase